MSTAETIWKEKRREMVAVSPDLTILEALRIMVDKNIGALLLKEEGKIVGIWTERDLLRNTILPGFNPETARIGDYMTTSLYAAPFDAPLLKLEEMYLGLFVRHILIEKEGEYIGMLSIGDVLRASLVEKDRKIRELNQIASWEYYENWNWERKKD
jgi:signal-transduction protein with cAMP-binding, CBS, and nucleotidyltransferase domain